MAVVSAKVNAFAFFVFTPGLGPQPAFSPERGCVEDQPQPCRTGHALRLVEDDTAALRNSAMVLSLRQEMQF
jgi:hypothetical protein